MKKRVLVAVTNDLHTDQRVNKVCLSLQKGGYEPTLFGLLRCNSTAINRDYQVVRTRMLFQRTFLFYAEFNLKLFFKIVFSKYDIILANDTDTLVGAYFAALVCRKPIVYDAHELFTEVPELIGRPFVKGIWQWIERLILPHIRYSYTVCQPIADIYNQKYGIQMDVVRNAPLTISESSSPHKRFTFGDKKMILYQGAINVGRGIEWVIDAMPYLDDVVFCIVGDGDIFKEIEKRIQNNRLQDKVFMLGKIPLEELNAYTLSADLGLSLLENRGLNYYYSLPNRIFDFAQAEVPVLATDFPEIRSVVLNYGIGTLIDRYDPVYLAEEIEKILTLWSSNLEKRSIFAKAKKDLCWENEEKILLSLFSKI